MYELIVAGFMFAALIFYAVTGDADYGGGIWDLLATGPRASAQRNAIERAIGPIWEADHVWLILIVVILFTAFPPAFAAMMTALNIPFTLMLIGIVLRGSAFIFRKYDIKSREVKRWSCCERFLCRVAYAVCVRVRPVRARALRFSRGDLSYCRPQHRERCAK